MNTPQPETGTPLYEVEISETRPVSVTRKFTILGGTPEAAIAEAEMKMKREWERLEDDNRGRFTQFSVGPKITDATVEG